MKGKLTLTQPIMIDGKKIKEFDYDTDEITIPLYAEAEKRKFGIIKGISGGAAELDYSFHTYLGMAAIIAKNPQYAFDDLERIKGRDIRTIMVLGRDFIKASDESEEEISEDAPESLPESSIQDSQTSKEKA